MIVADTPLFVSKGTLAARSSPSQVEPASEKMHGMENALDEDEIIAAFMSQENIGLAADHQDYAGDLVEDWNIDPAEWIEEKLCRCGFGYSSARS